MNVQTTNTIRNAQESVNRLVQVCRQFGPLYTRQPKAVAQVSRTAKWLLHAITVLNRELDNALITEEVSE